MFEDGEIKGLLKFRPWWTKLGPPTEQEGQSGEFMSSFKSVRHRLVLLGSVCGWVVFNRINMP